MQDPSHMHFVSWMRRAAPYIHAFRGKTFVLAFGGEVMQSDSANALAHDCNLLAALGIRLVLVHGARPQIEAEIVRRGLSPRYHLGRRVTDVAALECVKSAMCVTRLEIEALLSQGLPDTPMAGAYMRITGGNFITAKPVGVVGGVDFQYTGVVRKIVGEEIAADLDQQNVVLISPIGTSPSGEIFNLSMEDVAQSVAVALRAEKLIYLTDTPGVTDESGQILHAITADEGEKILRERSNLTEDQMLYLPCAVAAVQGGVARAHLIHRACDGGLLLEFFTREGVGTLVTRDALARVRQAALEDVGSLASIIAPLEADGTLVRRGRELLETEADRFMLLEHDGMPVGCAALYPFCDASAAELACLAVRAEYRRSGYGEMLLNYATERARNMGLKRLFVLTTRTADWFRERGFVEVSPDQLPEQKRELYNFQRRSKVLVRPI